MCESCNTRKITVSVESSEAVNVESLNVEAVNVESNEAVNVETIEENENVSLCFHCGIEHDNDELYDHDGQLYCDSCESELFFWCESCHEWYDVDGASSVNIGRNRTAYWCESCVSSSTFTCECCNTLFSDNISSSYLENYGTVCESCYDDVGFYCESCGSCYHIDDYHGDGQCGSCYEGDSNNGPKIKKYHSTKNNQKYIGKFRRLSPMTGYELEVESTNGTAEKLAESCGELLESFRVEADGSLSNGFEIISHALTYKEHKKTFKGVESLLSALIANGGRSHDTTTCGLHVHISKKYLKKSEQKFLVEFVQFNQAFFEKFARRKSNNYCSYNDYETSLSDRYSAVNLKNNDTVEFRFFKGTLSYTTFLACLEMAYCLYFYAVYKNKNYDLDSFKSFIKAKGRNFKNLKDYMARKNLF